MKELYYDREAAVAYAHRYAFSRNPRYYNFDNIGGDCTNFVSQCLYAGAKVMNYRPNTGWYYSSIRSRSPSWTSVFYLYRFLTTNQYQGPYGGQVDISRVQKGDIVQLKTHLPEFHHTALIVQTGEEKTLDTVLIAAHSYDSDMRPLSTYEIKDIRFIHIAGVRK